MRAAHDVVFWEKRLVILRLLQKVINVPAHPLTLDAWRKLFEESGLAVSDSKTGAFTLLSDEGLVRDEGREGRDTLIDNAMADDNFGQFSEMRTFFDLAKNDIGYVIMYSHCKSVQFTFLTVEVPKLPLLQLLLWLE